MVHILNKWADRGELGRKEGGNVLQGEASAGEGKPVRAGHFEILSRTGSQHISDPLLRFWSARGRVDLAGEGKMSPALRVSSAGLFVCNGFHL